MTYGYFFCIFQDAFAIKKTNKKHGQQTAAWGYSDPVCNGDTAEFN
jgi:hypothetical protein